MFKDYCYRGSEKSLMKVLPTNCCIALRVDLDLNCIKGGGACQLREKVLAEAAKTFIVVADYRKNSSLLGEKWAQGVPIEVAPFAYASVMRRLQALGGMPTLRMGGGAKAGPCVTDNS